MYTNIKTDAALTAISQYIREEFRTHPSPTYTQALTLTLNIVFNNSIVKFGDTYWRQISGTGWALPLHHHGQLSSIPFMSEPLSPNGKNISYSIKGLSMTSLVFGSLTHTPKQIPYSGPNSRTASSSGMILSGLYHPDHKHVISWIYI
jgi:hypothetical protein